MKLRRSSCLLMGILLVSWPCVGTEQDIDSFWQISSLNFGLIELCYAEVPEDQAVQKIEVLIKAGADPNAKFDRDSITPVICAIRNNKILIAKKLLELGARSEIDASDISRLSLTNATLVFIIEQMHLTDNAISELLDTAIEDGSQTTVSFLLDHIELSKIKYLEFTIERALSLGQTDIVELFVKKGFDLARQLKYGGNLMSKTYWDYRDIPLESIRLLRSKGIGLDKKYQLEEGEYFKLYIEFAGLTNDSAKRAQFLDWAVEVYDPGVNLSSYVEDGYASYFSMTLLEFILKHKFDGIVSLLKRNGLKLANKSSLDLLLTKASLYVNDLIALLKAGADPDEYGSDGKRTVDLAIVPEQSRNILEGVINKTIEIKSLKPISVSSPKEALDLYDSIELGDLTSIKQSLKKKEVSIDGTYQGDGGRFDTPLCWAIRGGRLEVVKLLISSGASKDKANGEWYEDHGQGGGEFPLLLALKAGALDIAKYLINIGAKIDNEAVPVESPYSCLEIAAELDDEDLFDRILAKERRQEELDLALAIAVYNLNLPRAKKLLSHGASFYSSKSLAYRFSNRSSDLAFTTFESYKGDDFGRVHLDFLFSLSYEPKKGLLFGESPFYWFPEFVPELIKKGVNIDITNERGESALATRYASLSEFLAYGANPNIKDDQGRTPLQWAVTWGNFEMAQALLGHGAKVGIKDNEDNTILHVQPYVRTSPSDNDFIKTYELVLSATDSFDVPNKTGQTQASTLQNLSGTSYLLWKLLAKGANPYAIVLTQRSFFSKEALFLIESAKLRWSKMGKSINHEQIQ